MRLLTWNCARGPYSKKLAQLARFAADVAVIQECPMPVAESERHLWFGDSPRQGVLIVAGLGYSLRRLPTLENVPQFVVPIAVTGPVTFTLFAVWSKGKQKYSYVRGVVKAVEMYREVFTTSECVLIGDLNANVIWDHLHPAALNQSALIKLLASLGLVSAYHRFHGESHGKETRPTYYQYRREAESFHIDYCFLPVAWAPRMTSVDVGGYEDWKAFSDHRPLVIDVASVSALT